MGRLVRAAVTFLLCLIWALFVLYPNPLLLLRSIPRAIHPPIDPAAVRPLARKLPDDPDTIQRLVLDKYVPYSVPWTTMGVPWYFPTPKEVLAQGSGDCEARMVVLASVLEAKHIPFKIEASVDHIWVWYPKKRPNALENNSVAFIKRTGGKVRIQVPKGWRWQESYRLEREYFWDPAPLSRKLLLFGGLFLIPLRHRLTGWLLAGRSPGTPAGQQP